jgi:hypothetical protein
VRRVGGGGGEGGFAGGVTMILEKKFIKKMEYY